MVQQLMEAEVTELVGAAHGERAPEERLTLDPPLGWACGVGVCPVVG
jgi:hypothetical protein